MLRRLIRGIKPCKSKKKGSILCFFWQFNVVEFGERGVLCMLLLLVCALFHLEEQRFAKLFLEFGDMSSVHVAAVGL